MARLDSTNNNKTPPYISCNCPGTHQSRMTEVTKRQNNASQKIDIKTIQRHFNTLKAKKNQDKHQKMFYKLSSMPTVSLHFQSQTPKITMQYTWLLTAMTSPLHEQISQEDSHVNPAVLMSMYLQLIILTGIVSQPSL